MSTFSDRLRAERERLGLSQVAFGDLCGVGKHAQINYEAGRRSPDGNYLMAAAAQGVDVLYILTGERSAASLPGELARVALEHLADPSEFAPVPLHEVALAAGPGRTNDGEDIIDHLAFRRSWLKRMGLSPAKLVIARAQGDSMEPTIHHGDVVLIDRARSEPPSKPRDPKDRRAVPIYALLDDGMARIKRIDLAAPGTLALLSDNPTSPPEFRPSAIVSIIGRVVWWGHTSEDFP